LNEEPIWRHLASISGYVDLGSQNTQQATRRFEKKHNSKLEIRWNIALLVLVHFLSALLVEQAIVQATKRVACLVLWNHSPWFRFEYNGGVVCCRSQISKFRKGGSRGIVR
jgi:hypothetical protein